MCHDEGKPRFWCRECHQEILVKDKGEASKDGEPYDVCMDCCQEEQKRQFYAEM